MYHLRRQADQRSWRDLLDVLDAVAKAKAGFRRNCRSSRVAGAWWLPCLALSSQTTEHRLLALAIGSGSLFFNYANHAGFWLVKESFGMTH